MNIITSAFHSSVGKKYVMAVTGGLLFSFVIIHLLGNLQIFLGRDALNYYAHLLKSKIVLVWCARLGLMLIALLHVTTATSLALENRAARPINYAVNIHPYTDWAARTMVFSGVVLACFILYHLLHFTVGVTDPGIMGHVDSSGRADVYGMVVQGFQQPVVSGFYIGCMVLLWWHLKHGISSLFQTVGLKNKHYAEFIELSAQTAALLIFIGNCSIPAAILAGWVK